MTAIEHLWHRWETVAAELQKLGEEGKALFERRRKCQDRPVAPWAVAEIESAFWATTGALNSLAKLECAIVDALEALERGEKVRNLNELLPEGEKRAEEALSKRRAAILRDRRFQPEESDFAADVFFFEDRPWLAAPETRLLTSGRNRKRLKGNFNPADAAVEFFAVTADTHGGKVRRGTKLEEGSAYLAKGGRRIRKQ